MFGWSRLSRANGEESDVNLLSADELSTTAAAALEVLPQSTPDGPPPPVLPTDDPPPAVQSLPSHQDPGTTTTRGGDGRQRSSSSSRRRRHHGGRGHRLCRFKKKESNFMTAVSCMFVVVLVCTSLAEPHWFYFSGGRCTDYGGQPINYVGVKLFFYPGSFQADHGSTATNVYHYGGARNEVLIDCVTPSTVFVMRVIIALCALVILFSFIAFVLHLLGSSHRVLRALRINAVFSIVSVIICIVINGLSYLVVEQLTNYFQMNPFHEGSRIDVQFSLGFYMITTAGAVSIIGVASSLLRRTASHSRREHRDQMTFRSSPSDLYPSSCSQPAPPPYSP